MFMKQSTIICAIMLLFSEPDTTRTFMVLKGVNMVSSADSGGVFIESKGTIKITDSYLKNIHFKIVNDSVNPIRK